jgi:cytochrome c556
MKRLWLLVLLSACVGAPKKNYSADEIKTIDDLEELMKVQAQTMDPLFKLRDQTAFSDAQFGSLADAGRMIQATSATARDRFATGHKPSFATFAEKLNQQAAELTSAADAKDAGRIRTTLSSLKTTCAGCHKENR